MLFYFKSMLQDLRQIEWVGVECRGVGTPQEGVEDGPEPVVFTRDRLGSAMVGGSCDLHGGRKAAGPAHQLPR